MIPLNLVWLQIKAQAQAIISAAVLIAIVGTGIYIKVLRSERDSARKEAATASKTIEGYVSATNDLKARLAAAKTTIDQDDVANKKLMAELEGTIPKDPSQATAWANEAARKIAAEAKR